MATALAFSGDYECLFLGELVTTTHTEKTCGICTLVSQVEGEPNWSDPSLESPNDTDFGGNALTAELTL